MSSGSWVAIPQPWNSPEIATDLQPTASLELKWPFQGADTTASQLLPSLCSSGTSLNAHGISQGRTGNPINKWASSRECIGSRLFLICYQQMAWIGHKFWALPIYCSLKSIYFESDLIFLTARLCSKRLPWKGIRGQATKGYILNIKNANNRSKIQTLPLCFLKRDPKELYAWIKTDFKKSHSPKMTGNV